MGRSRSRSPLKKRDREDRERSPPRSAPEDRDRDRDRERERGKDKERDRVRSESKERERRSDVRDSKRSRRELSPDRRRDSRDNERGERDRGEKDRGEKDRGEKDNGEKERDGSSRRESQDRPSNRDRDHDRGRGRSPSVPKDEAHEDREAKPFHADLPPPPVQELQGGVSKTRAEPLSLEELLKKKKLLEEEAAKPKFIPKKEREAMALQRRELDVALQNQRALGGGRLSLSSGAALPPPTSSSSGLDVLRRVQGLLSQGPSASSALTSPSSASSKGSMLPPPPPLPSSHDGNRNGGRDRDRWAREGGGGSGRDGRDGVRDDRQEDRRDDRKDSGRDGRGRDREPRDRRADDSSDRRLDREKEKELELIKQQYLGGDKQKKRIMKPSDKFKFNFDWDAGEDTSKDLNPLYNQTHEAALLFGRGMRAGIDRREQKKQLVSLERDSLRRSRAAAGIEETTETRRQEREREKLADQYDGFDMRTDKHWTEKDLKDMTERDWRIFREDFNISYKGNTDILPMRNWSEGKIPAELIEAIERVGYKKPSPIQMAAIPLGLSGKDVIGVAETGSGKTCAFMIPCLTYIMKQPKMDEFNCADGPYAVVLAPTRELAQQIEEEAIKLAHFLGFKTISVVGGQSIEEQGAKLRRGCEIVIATPGRLLDCIEKHYAVLNQCHYIVLDEADRMIDLGFEPQVIGVMDAMPSTNLKPEGEDDVIEANRLYRTTYMFSATMPPAVERLARKYMRKPIVINIGRAGQATDNVTQRVYMLKENEKASRLEQELDLVTEKRAIVFVNTKRQCDNVFNHMESIGHRCTVLHGGKTQDVREVSIKGFRDNTFNILIATDVAGRGIDVPDVTLVVNYDMPNGIEPYTHRIGRTGRAGKKGTAVTFLTMSDTEVFYDLKKLLEESKAAVPPELARHEASKQKPGSVDQRKEKVQYAKK